MIIKCPECGHQVSDKAPVCPSCGVEIAGKITRCPHCGEIHFISDGICPNCHHSLTPKDGAAEIANSQDDDNQNDSNAATNTDDTLDQESTIAQEERQLSNEEQPVQAIPITRNNKGQSTTSGNKFSPNSSQNKNSGQPSDDKKKNHWALIVSLIIAVGICLVLLFSYSRANRNNEEREFRTAIESHDPAIMQSYLNTYTNAPTAHRDSIKALLNAIRAADPQWDNVKGSSDIAQLKAYLQQNPNSPHKQEVLNKIDELDWKTALQTHDFANYLSLHQNGLHATEAVDSVKLTIDMPTTGEDKQKAVSAIRSFLMAINSHNADKVKNCMAERLEYFNEKSEVDGSEALNYMAIIYKNADRLNWHVDNADAAKVTKTGNGSSAQYSIIMPARLSVNYTSGNNVQAKYNIQAKIDPSGHIAAIKLMRLAEEKPKAAEKSSSEKAEKKSEAKTEKKPAEKKTAEKKSTDKKPASKKN